MNVITRFAPSPTGFQHVGGIRTALFAWLWARKNNGTFILRIEDTDKEREVAGAIDHTKESLSWLGIDWDYGPDKPGDFGSCIQSERLDSYKAWAQKLVDAGHAYPDPYTKEALEKFRGAAEQNNEPFLFRNHRPETFDTWDGKSTLRFKTPEIKSYEWNDAVRGELRAGEEALDDFILMKSDGYPTYNFAHIIDDHEMGVTHVFRGDEFISSTPKFLSLYEALEITPPVFVTLPPILNDTRTKKLSKRDGAKDILEYRKAGYLPEAVMNFLAFIGWNPGGEKELYTKDELLTSFSLDQIQVSGGAFNEEKLRWFNREYILKLSDEAFLTHANEYLSDNVVEKLTSENRLNKLVPVLRERIETFGDIKDMEEAGELSYFVDAPTYDVKNVLFSKEPDESKTKARMEHIYGQLEALEEQNWAYEAIKESIWDYATEEGRGAVLWPFRYSLTGADKSPDPFLVADILGKNETLSRVKTAIKLLS